MESPVVEPVHYHSQEDAPEYRHVENNMVEILSSPPTSLTLEEFREWQAENGLTSRPFPIS